MNLEKDPHETLEQANEIIRKLNQLKAMHSGVNLYYHNSSKDNDTYFKCLTNLDEEMVAYLKSLHELTTGF